MSDTKITIIGCGNLGRSIAHGLLKSDAIKPANIRATRRNTASLADLQAQGITVLTDNREAITGADLILIGVKPYSLKAVLADLKETLQPGQIVASLATGISLHAIQDIIGEEHPVFRAMPNIAADVQASVTCVCHSNADENHTALVHYCFDQIGQTIFIREDLMEAATVLGACGIAYVLRFMRAMVQGGIEIGFDAQTAQAIVNQTVTGAAGLLLKDGAHPEAVIDKVTTPKGCTIVGLNEMEHRGFSSSLIKGIATSFEQIDTN